jgi:oxygen-dependent protoporphyrinogen oxidase
MKVAIVGSGVSALACGVRLKQRGIDFTIFEKESSPGGKLSTEKIDDFIVEGGPDSFLPEKHWTVDLIKETGLEGELLPTNEAHKGTYIYSGGRLHRLPEGVMLMVPTMIMPLLRSGLISWPGKIRMGMELFVPKKTGTDEESLARFVTRRLGRECLDKIAEPLVAGIHTSNPDNMSVRAIFPRFLDMEQKHGSLIKAMTRAMKAPRPDKGNGREMTYFMSLKGGMQELADASIRFIGEDRIATKSAVDAVTGTADGYRVLVGSEQMSFDAVVLTVPSYSAAGMVRSLDPVLADRLSPIEWSSTATISLAFRKKDIPATLPGFGFLVPRIEGRRINAATWSSVKWSFRAPSDFVLIRCFVGGGHDEELVSYDDKDLLRVVLGELSSIAAIQAEPVLSRIFRWVKSMPRYTVGHLARIAAIDETLDAHPGLHLIGSSYRGIGIGDCVKSGFDAAEKISASALRRPKSTRAPFLVYCPFTTSTGHFAARAILSATLPRWPKMPVFPCEPMTMRSIPCVSCSFSISR